jgi:hypothetical protein
MEASKPCAAGCPAPDFHPASLRNFAATSATTAGSHAGQGRERFGSPATHPQRRRNSPVTPLRNANSSATPPQRRTPCHHSNVAALRIKRQLSGLPISGNWTSPGDNIHENYFAGSVDPDAPTLLTCRQSISRRKGCSRSTISTRCKI